jgi:hypothetical protein
MQMSIQPVSIGFILALVALVVVIVLMIMGQLSLPIGGVLLLLALARLV